MSERKVREDRMTDKESDRVLKEIRTILDEMKSIFILANQNKLEEMKNSLLPKDSIKEKIYELCDGTRTTSDIAQAIGKDNNYVRSYLSILRREGLIRTVEKEGKQVHEQIF